MPSLHTERTITAKRISRAAPASGNSAISAQPFAQPIVLLMVWPAPSEKLACPTHSISSIAAIAAIQSQTAPGTAATFFRPR